MLSTTEDSGDFIRIVSERFGVVPMPCVPEVKLGEVLLDSRGKGSLQQSI